MAPGGSPEATGSGASGAEATGAEVAGTGAAEAAGTGAAEVAGAEATGAEIAEAMELLRRSGGRVTRARRAVLAALLAGADRHRSAEELAADVAAVAPEVSPSTVYRALERLEELGVAYHVHLGHGAARWHLAGADHGHLLCAGCGKVVEVSPSSLEEMAAHVRAGEGFEVDLRHFALPGTCRSCLSG